MGTSDGKTGGKGGRGAAGGEAPGGERIAKVLARRGVASRRAAEAMIAEGRVTVNGRVIESPALNVTPDDTITVDGRPLPEAEPSRLWLYHKPQGLVTTEKDERGRPTVFGALPAEMGRVVSVGRLDLNSEGLLLLTNDGELKRRLELPSTGWLRKYRVRVHGVPSEAALEPLRQGITVDGERFQPMEVSLDRQQGANAWLTVGLREGKNREVRRAMDAVGLTVNRLIRVSYGPFRLGELKPGQVEEVRRKVLRDQLGLAAFEQSEGQGAGHGGKGPRAAGPPSRHAQAGRTAPPRGPRGPKRQDAAAEPAAKSAERTPKLPRGTGRTFTASAPASRGRGRSEKTAAPPTPPRGRGPRPGGPKGGPKGRGSDGGSKGGAPKPKGPGRKG
jgi:23S rRNA pseudouridine2605 synthase